MSNMSKDAMAQVALAEKEAQDIRREAAEEAKRILAAAEKDGQAELERIQKETDTALRAEIESIRKKADELLERSRREAEETAKEQMIQARRGLGTAVKLIIGGMGEQCQ